MLEGGGEFAELVGAEVAVGVGEVAGDIGDECFHGAEEGFPFGEGAVAAAYFRIAGLHHFSQVAGVGGAGGLLAHVGQRGSGGFLFLPRFCHEGEHRLAHAVRLRRQRVQEACQASARTRQAGGSLPAGCRQSAVALRRVNGAQQRLQRLRLPQLPRFLAAEGVELHVLSGLPTTKTEP